MSSASPGNDFACDTMALVLRLEKRKLGAQARTAFALVEAGNSTLHIPAMVLAEILYLSEKQRLHATLADVRDYQRQHPTVKECALTIAVLDAAAAIHDIPELHDRLIAGAAVYLQAALVTNDAVIRQSQALRTIW
jgi:predicted nucleic acid-binding protein